MKDSRKPSEEKTEEDGSDQQDGVAYRDWNANLENAKAFYLKKERWPEHDEIKGNSLYSWIASQQTKRRSGKLIDEKALLLTNIDPDFFEKLNDRRWDSMYDAVKNYIEKNGHPPQGQGDELASWVYHQHRHIRNGDMPEDRHHKLLMLDGKLFLKDDEEWIAYYEDVIKHRETYRSIPGKENADLYGWLDKQKKDFKRNKLDIFKIALLVKLDESIFNFRNLQWNASYNEVGSYFKQNGKYQDMDMLHGYWILLQRIFFANGKLKPENQQKLMQMDPDFFKGQKDEILQAIEAGNRLDKEILKRISQRK